MSVSVFLVILGDINPNKFFKKSKTSCTIFFGTPFNILRGKRIKNSKGHGYIGCLDWNGLESLKYIKFFLIWKYLPIKMYSYNLWTFCLFVRSNPEKSRFRDKRALLTDLNFLLSREKRLLYPYFLSNYEIQCFKYARRRHGRRRSKNSEHSKHEKNINMQESQERLSRRNTWQIFFSAWH